MEIIQQSKNNSCLACVMAMIVNESEQYVLDWFTYNNPPFNDEDAFIFLAHHGYYLSFSFTFKEDYPEGVSLKGIDTVTVEMELKNRSAYLVVQSKTNYKYKHAVFLKNGMIYDPLFSTPQKIDNYKVYIIYPLMTTKQRQ